MTFTVKENIKEFWVFTHAVKIWDNLNKYELCNWIKK